MSDDERPQTPFVKFNKDTEQTRALQDRPTENHVLNCIVRFARRLPDPVHSLEPGECWLPNHANMGLTRQSLRTAISNLQKWQYITRRSTNKGTIVRLANSGVYDLNIPESTSDQPSTNQQTTNDQPATNQPATTDKECKKEKNGKNEQESDLFGSGGEEPDNGFERDFWNKWPTGKKAQRPACEKLWAKLSNRDRERASTYLDRRVGPDPANPVDYSWAKENKQFVPGPDKFLRRRIWEDDYSPAPWPGRSGPVGHRPGLTEANIGAAQRFANRGEGNES